MAESQPFCLSDPMSSDVRKQVTNLFKHPGKVHFGDEEDIKNHFRNLQNYREKEIKAWWQKETLLQYSTEGIVPRGLRITKKWPTFSRDDAEFMQEWKKILQDCSMNLIELIVKQKEKELSNINAEINEIQKDLSHFKTSEFFDGLNDQLQKYIQTFERREIVQRQNKFERDQMDYKTGHIYWWRIERTERSNFNNKTILKNRNYGKAKYNNYRDDTITVQSDSSFSSSASFLESHEGLASPVQTKMVEVVKDRETVTQQGPASTSGKPIPRMQGGPGATSANMDAQYQEDRRYRQTEMPYPEDRGYRQPEKRTVWNQRYKGDRPVGGENNYGEPRRSMRQPKPNATRY
ncbi:uncharacterized protein LOC121397635 [Xenopus laevis]|uniref:Uncharacterized protein LOC121397635 n=2 Tax=Xenopus laevis TaxID=8355 RepID=A0A8J1LN60_XENLA|nr:uncharacterized protein LOC121397635 [Xenopus laevis]